MALYYIKGNNIDLLLGFHNSLLINESNKYTWVCLYIIFYLILPFVISIICNKDFYDRCISKFYNRDNNNKFLTFLILIIIFLLFLLPCVEILSRLVWYYSVILYYIVFGLPKRPV